VGAKFFLSFFVHFAQFGVIFRGGTSSKNNFSAGMRLPLIKEYHFWEKKYITKLLFQKLRIFFALPAGAIHESPVGKLGFIELLR